MSAIDMLEIAGIRSFAPEPPQTIKFYKPLTVIVGDNGAGKTTVIESLKFATTGNMPADTDRGRAFVFDPKLAGASEVKARVRLRFRTRGPTGLRTFEVTRLLQVTQTRKTATMKQLEGVLTTKNERNEVVERLSQRCTDLDKTVPALLGISAAILDNVVFCHQEDSNWPMQDGAALKKKFDDIFESTRYSKALEDVRKKRKELNEEAKVSESELNVLRTHQQASQEIQKELKEREEQMGMLTEKAKEYKVNVEEGERREEALKVKIVAVESRKSDLDRLRGQLQSATEDQRACRDVIEQEGIVDSLEGSTYEETEELKTTIADQLAELDRKVTLNQKSVQDLRNRRAKCEEEVNKRSKDKGRLEESARHLDGITRQFIEKAKEAAAQFGMTSAISTTGVVTRENATALLSAFDAELARHKEAQRRMRDDRKSVMDGLESELSKARVALDRAKEDINQKTKQSAKVAADVKNAQAAVKITGGATPDLAKVTTKRLEEARERLRQAEEDIANYNPAAVDNSGIIAERNKLADTVADLKTRLAEIQSAKSKLSQLTTKRGQVASAASKIESQVRSLVGRVPSPGDVKDALQNVLNMSKMDLGVKEQDALRASNALAQRKGELASLEQSKRKLEAEMASLEAGPLVDCKDEYGAVADVSEKLARLRADRDDFEESKAAIDSFKKVLDRFERNACDTNKCMACTRVFANDGERQASLTALTTLRSKLSRPAMEEKATKLTELKAEIQSAEVTMEDYRTWTTKKAALAEVISRLDEVLPFIHTLQTEKDTTEKVLAIAKEKVATASALLPDAVTLERDFAEFSRLMDEVDEFGGEDRADSIASEETALSAQLTRAETRLNDLSRMQQDSDSHRVEMDRERLEAKEELTQLEALSKMIAERDQLERELAALRASISGLDESFASIQARRNEASHQCEKASDAAATQYSLCLGMQGHIAKLAKDYADAEVTNPRVKLSEIVREEAKLKSESDGISSQLRSMEQDMQESVDNKAELVKLRAQLDHLQRYRQAVDKRKAIEHQVKEIHKSLNMSEEELKAIEKELATVRASLESNKTKYAKLRGSIETYKAHLNDARVKLKDPKYDKIDERCRDVMIRHETAVMAVGDLDRYYKALDTALTHYHDLKIKEINAIIRDLWTNTYKGLDIENIAIRSSLEDESGEGAEVAAAPSRKRNFNYRVVMTKGDTELSMKGRCSAGQKVLASLVIRLALAESFCLSCGILALDEPTTNLDRDNKEGLAKAIADIIDSKREQTNFQLIVITHEADFVEMLARHIEGGGGGPGGGLGHYFVVSREETPPGKYRSRIDRQDYAT